MDLAMDRPRPTPGRASRAHIAVQFVAEAALLAVTGGTAGAVLGGFATAVYAASRNWSAVVPLPVLLAAVGLALLLGAVPACTRRCVRRGWHQLRRCGSSNQQPCRVRSDRTRHLSATMESDP
jgi:hypothetical protein